MYQEYQWLQAKVQEVVMKITQTNAIFAHDGNFLLL